MQVTFDSVLWRRLATVHGQFTSARKATGTIKFTQSEGADSATCTVTFTAKAKS